MRTGMKKRVLLVDDDFAVLAGLAGVLVSEGYSVVHAADADEAIEKFREDRSFDIVLLDLNMPRIDGRQALAEIRADPMLRRIPVVILTTSRSDEDVCETYDLGVNSYISKPVTFGGRRTRIVSCSDETNSILVKRSGTVANTWALASCSLNSSIVVGSG